MAYMQVHILVGVDRKEPRASLCQQPHQFQQTSISHRLLHHAARQDRMQTTSKPLCSGEHCKQKIHKSAQHVCCQPTAVRPCSAEGQRCSPATHGLDSVRWGQQWCLACSGILIVSEAGRTALSSNHRCSNNKVVVHEN